MSFGSDAGRKKERGLEGVMAVYKMNKKPCYTAPEKITLIALMRIILHISSL